MDNLIQKFRNFIKLEHDPVEEFKIWEPHVLFLKDLDTERISKYREYFTDHEGEIMNASVLMMRDGSGMFNVSTKTGRQATLFTPEDVAENGVAEVIADTIIIK